MRRPDPLETRARELAVAAGLNPDDRVGEGRGMPLWCSFRDAARQEHLVKEAAAVELPPQAPQYQNSPLKVFGEHAEGTLAQMRNCMGVGNVVAGTICADGHLGYAQPVGGVIAYDGQISISGVGFDIGCGNMAIRLDTPFAAIEDRVGEIIRDVARVISFGIGRRDEERVEHELFDDGEAWRASDMETYRQKAAGQLGTVGSGNHYVDLMRDEEGLVWIGVHFGSRGLGHTSATRYLKAAGGQDGMNVPPAVIDENSELGSRHIAAMELAVAMPMRAASGSASACAGRSAEPKPIACTITTTMPGASATATATCGSCARARHRHSRASAASSAAPWATTRSSSRASIAMKPAPRFIRRSARPAKRGR